ncbi:MAG TPA: universal stress protein [Mycobacterium sp.]|nr:universal stress protein [Mycobacterium sp.]
MIDRRSGASVVVGIDGSAAAIHAAVWAIDEAISRDMPLRLVYVTHREEVADAHTDEASLDMEYAETALRAAHAAVEATGKTVKVDTAILRGRPAEVLIDESRDAELVCVGSVGIGRLARVFLGSTAAALAERAYCPVAIIRSRPDAPADVQLIAVVFDASPESDVVRYAMCEAQLRKVPVLALGGWPNYPGESPHNELDRRVRMWHRRYSDVRIDSVPTLAGIVRYLAEHGEPARLVVIGASDAGQVATIVGPHRHGVYQQGECSVIVVRHSS